ncbi:polysaccharide deacetylase family protein [Shewanella sp. SR43-4]|uniref:polysaccharide deacetylase family protein n=1 Tax=Shewanella sp. SR43-4 TaxID=2760942 RepID=UPI0015FE5DE9|nr:polysaccharide deacetylase family protein [Shewanella sp. SR43-4]MBB1318431.1 polysaccharide deacetylase family protein [Shewanella sp. SR43-4]
MVSSIRKLLRDNYLSFAGNLASQNLPSAHILAGHYIALDNLNSFERLKILNRFYDTLQHLGELSDFDDVAKRIKNRDLPTDRSIISLCFDDGFKECEDIANFFDKKGIKIGFFINSGSIEADQSYYPEHHERLVIQNKSFLDWKTLKDMHSAGHTVGSHTFDHMRLNITDSQTLLSQIVEDKIYIERKLDSECDFFAWPYGTAADISKDALNLATETFKYVFSSCNYERYESNNNDVITRRHIEPFWKHNHIKYFLSQHRNY